MNIESLYGTRAEGTDRLIYRILQTPENRTVEIVARLLDAVLVTDPDSKIDRVQNLVSRMQKYGDSAVPRNEFDLASWSDLSVTGTEVKAVARSTRRKYKRCLGCHRRFLAKRANNTVCSPRCQRRALRKSAVSGISEMTAPNPA